MRGSISDHAMLFSYLSPEARVPATHPLRPIKAIADAVLQKLSPTFEAMYSQTGRPSIPPERLLKGELLIALFSVRGHRLFCEMLDYHILFRWFLDMSLDEPIFDHSTFSQNSERVLAHEAARKFFDAVVGYARGEGLLSDEHFTVDGTRIEAWASLKSVKPHAAAPPSAPPDDPGNPTVNFHARPPHQCDASEHDRSGGSLGPQRRGQGDEAVFLGTCADGESAWPLRGPADRPGHRDGGTGHRAGHAASPGPARDSPHDRRRRQGLSLQGLRPPPAPARDSPHLACIRGRRTPGLDGRTTRHEGYRLSQRLRQKSRRDLRLDEDDRGLAEEPGARGGAHQQPATWSAQRIICCVSVACGPGRRRYEWTRSAQDQSGSGSPLPWVNAGDAS